MFKLFKKKTESEKLENQYHKLMSDWHKLSSTNRAESDKVFEKAKLVLKKIEDLNKVKH
jgi:hypothetical protein